MKTSQGSFGVWLASVGAVLSTVLFILHICFEFRSISQAHVVELPPPGYEIVTNGQGEYGFRRVGDEWIYGASNGDAAKYFASWNAANKDAWELYNIHVQQAEAAKPKPVWRAVGSTEN